MSALQQSLLGGVAAVGLPPGVAPTIMTTASFWVKPVDPTTLYKDMSGTTVGANGDDIATARDANGAAILLKAQNSAGSMPDYLTADVNGFDVLSSINSNGSANSPMHGYLAASAGSGVPSGSTLPVSSIITASAMTWSGALYVASTGGGAGYDADAIWTDSGGYVGVMAQDTGSGAINIVASVWSGGQKSADTQSFAGMNAWFIVSVKHEGGSLKIRLNGGSWRSVACGNVEDVSGALRCFQRYNSAIGLPELKTVGMAWWNTALSDADLLDVERYWGGMVGIAI